MPRSHEQVGYYHTYGEPRVIRGNGNRLSEASIASLRLYEAVDEPEDLSLSLITRVDPEDLFMGDFAIHIDDVMFTLDEGRDDWSIPIRFPDGSVPVSVGFFMTREAARKALPLIRDVFGEVFDEAGAKTSRPRRIREVYELPL
jgi:hypothetical protein